MLVALLASLLAEGPALFADIENVFNDIAHGPGGTAKIAKASAALSALAGHVAKAAVSVPPS